MNRVTVTTWDGQRDGWFDDDAAEGWVEPRRVFRGGEVVNLDSWSTLLRTSQGRWVIRYESAWSDTPRRHHYIEDDEARDWVVQHAQDDPDLEQLLERFWPETPAEVQVGRPEVGPQVVIRMQPDLIGAIDTARGAMSRAEWIRQACAAALR